MQREHPEGLKETAPRGIQSTLGRFSSGWGRGRERHGSARNPLAPPPEDRPIPRPRFLKLGRRAAPRRSPPRVRAHVTAPSPGEPPRGTAHAPAPGPGSRPGSVASTPPSLPGALHQPARALDSSSVAAAFSPLRGSRLPGNAPSRPSCSPRSPARAPRPPPPPAPRRLGGLPAVHPGAPGREKPQTPLLPGSRPGLRRLLACGRHLLIRFALSFWLLPSPRG